MIRPCAGEHGDCMIGTLNCDEAAVIDLRDGDVRVDGLDGRASVLKRRRGATVSGGLADPRPLRRVAATWS